MHTDSYLGVGKTCREKKDSKKQNVFAEVLKTLVYSDASIQDLRKKFFIKTVHRGSEVAKWMLSKVAKFLTTSTLSNEDKIKHLKFRTLMFADNDFYHEKFMADRGFDLRFFAAA